MQVIFFSGVAADFTAEGTLCGRLRCRSVCRALCWITQCVAAAVCACLYSTTVVRGHAGVGDRGSEVRRIFFIKYKKYIPNGLGVFQKRDMHST